MVSYTGRPKCCIYGLHSLFSLVFAPSQLAPSQLARLRCSNTFAYRFSSKRETARSRDIHSHNLQLLNSVIANCDNYHQLQVCFLLNIFGKRSDLPFSRKRRKAWFRLRICSKTQLDDIAHEQTITCRQLFAGHVVGFRPMKRKNNWSTQNTHPHTPK